MLSEFQVELIPPNPPPTPSTFPSNQCYLHTWNTKVLLKCCLIFKYSVIQWISVLGQVNGRLYCINYQISLVLFHWQFFSSYQKAYWGRSPNEGLPATKFGTGVYNVKTRSLRMTYIHVMQVVPRARMTCIHFIWFFWNQCNSIARKDFSNLIFRAFTKESSASFNVHYLAASYSYVIRIWVWKKVRYFAMKCAIFLPQGTC